MMTAGAYDGEKTVVGSGESTRTFFIKDGMLRGYIILGDVAGAGIYTSLIREKTPLETLDLDSLFREPTLAAFPKSYRKKILAAEEEA